MRCQKPSREGTAKTGRCGYSMHLHLETLVATRGQAFPCAMLQSRLKCPRCGHTNVLVVFHSGPGRARAASG